MIASWYAQLTGPQILLVWYVLCSPLFGLLVFLGVTAPYFVERLRGAPPDPEFYVFIMIGGICAVPVFNVIALAYMGPLNLLRLIFGGELRH